MRVNIKTSHQNPCKPEGCRIIFKGLKGGGKSHQITGLYSAKISLKMKLKIETFLYKQMLKEFIPVNHNPGNVHISPSVSNEDNSQKDGAFREE